MASFLFNIDALNDIAVDSGGVGGHRFDIDALNEICDLLGGEAGHQFSIAALNEICELLDGEGGHQYDIAALNEIAVLAGGAGGHQYDINALNVIADLSLGEGIRLSGFSIVENAANGTVVGTFSLSGDYTGTPVFALSDDAGGRFDVDGDDLEKAGALNYEMNASHQVTATVSGTTPAFDPKTFTINVTNVLEVTLAALTLSDDEVSEDDAPGTVVGAIQNKSSGSTIVLTDDDAGRYAISGTNLVVGSTALVAGTDSITIRETHADGSNSPRDTVLSVTVNEELEAGLEAPELTWVTGANDATPQIDLTHADLQEGDTVVFQFDTVDTFDSGDLIELENEVDAGEDAAEELNFTLPDPLTEDTWFVRARVDRDGHEEGDWSDDVSKTLDLTAPSISTLSPADNATGVAVGANFVITFSETVIAGASASFRLYETTGDVLVEEFDETDFGGAVVIADDEVTINWTADLDNSVDYYVQIDAGSVTDAAGNAFAGIATETTWNVTTVGAGGGTVLVDDVLGNTNTGSSPLTITGMTIAANANRVLVVGICFLNTNAGTNSAVSATWNGDAMYKIAGPFNNGGTIGDAYLFGLVNPDAGASNLVVSWTGGSDKVAAGFVSLYDADQTGTTTTFQNVTNGTGSGSPASRNVTTVAGEVAVGVFMIGSNFSTPVHSALGSYADSSGNVSAMAVEYNEASGTSTNVGYNCGGGTWLAAGVSVKAA